MKYGVVGYGSIGSRHTSSLEALGHDVLVYDPVLRRDVNHEHDIYDKCDAVVIASPTIFHGQAIRACVERGRHMLIEKPMARAADGLAELLDIATDKKLVVMMGNNLRFHPCIKQAKAWVDADKIGDPIWAHFTCAAQSSHKGYVSDGVILNTGAHEVDVALHLFGPATVINANVDSFEFGSDMIADFLLQHESDVRSSFHLDFVTPNAIREAWIVGDEERIGIDLIGRRISLGDETFPMKGSYDDDYFAEMLAFVDCIEGRPTPAATGEDGLDTLKVLLDVRAQAGLV